MSVKTKRVILAGFLCILIILSTGWESKVSDALAQAYTEILAFGDSLSDNGKYGQYADAVNISPNDAFGFKRFSNGPVWVEYLAGPSHLNVPLLDLAYGGATTGWDNPAAGLSITGLQWQVAAYQSAYSTIAPTALVTLWAGGNDMFNARSPVTAAQNIGLAIQNLISIGGQDFLVPNLSYTDTDPYKPWKQPFDTELAFDLAALKATNPGIDIYPLDLNGFVPTGIDHYDGTWKGHYMPYPTPDGALEGAPDMGPGTYAWWDYVGVHPTTEVHVQIAAYAAAATEVPEPSTMLLIASGLIGLAGYGRKKFFKK
jgi:phospholipase/lecithinase/hemolysin